MNLTFAFEFAPALTDYTIESALAFALLKHAAGALLQEFLDFLKIISAAAAFL